MDVRDGISLDHLDRMTDSTGLIQHAIYGIPRRESGYTTDDNARALRLCARPRLVSTDGEFHTLRRLLDRIAEDGVEVVKLPATPVSNEVLFRLVTAGA